MNASTLVIFGITGDLAQRKLLPALFHLFLQDLLPRDFNIVGFARRDQDQQAFIENFRENLAERSKNFDLDFWKGFSKKLHYVRGDFDEQSDYINLAKFLKKFDPKGSCTNKIFYMATAPNYFTKIIENLETTKVLEIMGECWYRIIVEKPFGFDLESSQKLNKLINDRFPEGSVYRIDHYLAKETVQNILAFRFANGLFEPIWNNEFIDHIQITAAEDFGVEQRGGYYDQSGNLRDIVQNHLLQLLALTTMEQPLSFDSEAIRDSRLQALKNVKNMTPEEIRKNVVFGQYAGYRQEEKVARESSTDTFTALRVYIDSPRWQGVPVYLRSGKKLPERSVYINVAFKEPVNKLFPTEITIPNVLTFFIQPESRVSIRLMAKKPGHKLTMEPVDMHFNYEEVFNVQEPEAYEKLLLDIIQGVQTFFPRADEIEASWEFIDLILKEKDKLPLYSYKTGSWGPKEAQELTTRDGREWFGK